MSHLNLCSSTPGVILWGQSFNPMPRLTAKREEREASKRWCPSCEEIVITEWGECKGHQTKGHTGPWFGCGAILIKPAKAKKMEHVSFPRPEGAISHATLIRILNTSGLRPRYQKINGGTAAVPMGERAEVPHNTQCPLCQKAQIYGIYVTSYTDGRRQLEIACADCATSKIPFRRDMSGVVCVRFSRLWAVIECVGQDSWRVETI